MRSGDGIANGVCVYVRFCSKSAHHTAKCACDLLAARVFRELMRLMRIESPRCLWRTESKCSRVCARRMCVCQERTPRTRVNTQNTHAPSSLDSQSDSGVFWPIKLCTHIAPRPVSEHLNDAQLLVCARTGI